MDTVLGVQFKDGGEFAYCLVVSVCGTNAYEGPLYFD